MDVHSDLRGQRLDEFTVEEVDHVSDALRWREGVAAVVLGASQGQRQGIGGVGCGRFGQLEHALDHFGHGQFLGRAVANDRLLNFARRDFVNFQARLGDGRQSRAPRFAHSQGGLQILGEEQSLDDAHCRTVLADDVAHGLGNPDQAAGMFPGRRTGDGALGECLRMRPGDTNDAVACPAQRWINAENDFLAR